MSSPLLNSPLMNKTPEQLKVTELKEELKRRGMSGKGLKKDLVERLEGALREEAAKATATLELAAQQDVEAELQVKEAVIEESNEQTVAAEMQVKETVTEVQTVPDEMQVKDTVTEVIQQEAILVAEFKEEPEPTLAEESKQHGSEGTVVEETTTVTTVVTEETMTEVAENKEEKPVMTTVHGTTVTEEFTLQEESLKPLQDKPEAPEADAKEDKAVEQAQEAKIPDGGSKGDLEAKIPDGESKEELEARVKTEVVKDEKLDMDENAQANEVPEEPLAKKDEENMEVKEKDGLIKEEPEGPILHVDGEDKDSKADSDEMPDSAVTDKVDMDVDAEAQAGLKRKDHGEGEQVDQNKRQRRWNSGKNMGAEAETRPKVSSDLSVNVGSNVAGSNSIGSRPLADRPALSRPVVSPRSDTPNNGRIVSPSAKNPTTSLRIDRFVRPFTLKALKDLLAETGSYSDFWMDQIKTHCYVTYSSVEEAVATRNALHNLKWPVVGGKQLIAEFVEPEEVKQKCEGGGNEKPAAVTIPRGTGGSAFPSPVSPFAPSAAPTPPAHREKPALPAKREAEPIVTLDDLFKKTSAKPNIYYLPLTEAQVAAKLVAKT